MIDLDLGKMLAAIRESGLTDRKIAAALEIDATSIPRLLRHYLAGGVPNFYRGEAIRKLWLEATGLPESQAPLRSWQPKAKGKEEPPEP